MILTLLCFRAIQFKLDTNATPQFIGSLTEMVWAQIREFMTFAQGLKNDFEFFLSKDLIWPGWLTDWTLAQFIKSENISLDLESFARYDWRESLDRYSWRRSLPYRSPKSGMREGQQFRPTTLCSLLVVTKVWLLYFVMLLPVSKVAKAIAARPSRGNELLVLNGRRAL